MKQYFLSSPPPHSSSAPLSGGSSCEFFLNIAFLSVPRSLGFSLGIITSLYGGSARLKPFLSVEPALIIMAGFLASSPTKGKKRCAPSRGG